MTHHGRQLPAKILKRAGQLRRLGIRGMAHTTYVATLGRGAYALTDPVRELRARMHRQKRLTSNLDWRAGQLSERLSRRPPAADTARASPVTWTFGTERGRFVQALEALIDLSEAGCAVPQLIEVDWISASFTTASVRGRRVGELDLPATKREQIGAAIAKALIEIHQAGYVLDRVESESVVVDRGRPVIAGLQHALPIGGLSRDMSVHFRDRDRRMFNRLFGTKLVTAADLRRSRASSRLDGDSGAAKHFYAPVVVRDDIHWGKIWNTDVGIGRWNFIMERHLPIPAGGRILDLGSNNGFNPLQMLRAGAASAVGVEISEKAIRQGEFLKSVYEWLDNRSYDFRYVHGSIGELERHAFERFDMVTALCSLYYLEEEEMRAAIRHIRTLTDLLILQCNTDRLIDRSSEETYRKASVEFALDALKRGGFEQCKVIAPPGYSRPLIIASA